MLSIEGLLFLKGGVHSICFYEALSYFFSDYNGKQISNDLHTVFVLQNTFWKTQNTERTAM